MAHRATRSPADQGRLVPREEQNVSGKGPEIPWCAVSRLLVICRSVRLEADFSSDRCYTECVGALMASISAERPLGGRDTPLPDVSELEKAEDRAAVDAIVATLVYHLRKEHPRPSPEQPARRDAHPKHHGCVPATFEVHKLDGLLAQGLFAHPGKYQAWVRFSNAFKVRNDLDRDARGMAIRSWECPEAPAKPLRIFCSSRIARFSRERRPTSSIFPQRWPGPASRWLSSPGPSGSSSEGGPSGFGYQASSR